ncbi:MAG: hypothetical protein ACR2NV_03490 [Thermoleophilaceae bacterium]
MRPDAEPDLPPVLSGPPPTLADRIADLAGLLVVAAVLGVVFVAVRRLLARRAGGVSGAPDARGLPKTEVLLAALGGAFLAVAGRWPLPLHMTSEVPAELQDPILQAWQVAWGGHALLTQPLDPFQANVHWPLENALAYTDGLLGFAPVGLLGQLGATAALVGYNGLYLLAYALAFLGAYLLAREIGAPPAAAALAGVAFAYAPWRIAQENHMNVLSSGGIPLSVFLLARGYRRQVAGLVLGGFGVAIGQVSLGFALGLQFGYALAALAVVGAAVWLARGRPAPRRAVAAATLLGAGLLAAGTLLLASPYLEAVRDNPNARRSYDRVRELSPAPRSFLAAPAESLVWGGPTAPARAGLIAPGEQTLFPGLLASVLALVGLLAGRAPPPVRLGLAGAAAVLAVIALGAGLADGALGYRWLYEHAPGWDSVRTPGRLMTLISLALALLASLGAGRLLDRVGARARGPLAVGLCALVMLEGFNLVDLFPVPPPPPAQRGAPAPQLHAPSDLTFSQIYTFWSVDDGFPVLLNGGGSTPDTVLDAVERPVARHFPDAATVTALRRAGVRSLVFHPDLARGTRWEGLERRPVRGLPIRRRRGGGVVVYEIDPGGGSER